ncbi:MAG: hypothetical protein KDC93_18570, partial [Cyclobacteriaceae bacterium]|nr:hypothetical protein [Cyclobacteriaceae bacterium]
EKKQCELIKGDFSPDDALEIINHLITKKITFHELRSFSSEIRFGEVDQKSIDRSKELKQSKASVEKFIQQAKEQNKTLRIKSNILIELI